MKNANVLVNRMHELGLSKEQVSGYVGISLGSLNNKLAGRTRFTVPEAKAIQTLLKFTDEEIISIFFKNPVTKIETEVVNG